MDAGNLLKPMLARGELHCIGATTLDEYRKHIEKDAALERRFQPVMVDQPSVEDTISILRGLRERYQNHHKVTIKDAALVAAAVLSNRYIADRFLPDKAIDLVDEAAAKLRTEIDSMPTELDTIHRQIMQLEIEQESLKKEKDAASKDRLARLEKELNEAKKKKATLEEQWRTEKAGVGRLGELRKKIEEAKLELEHATAPANYARAAEIKYGVLPELEREVEGGGGAAGGRNQGKPSLIKNEVDEEDIAAVVSRWTGIPVSRLAGRRDAEAAGSRRRTAQARHRPGRGGGRRGRRRGASAVGVEGPQPADRLVPLPGADRRGQDGAGAGAGGVPVRRRAGHDPHRHVGVSGEAHGRPPGRRPAGLRRLRGRRPADRGGAPPAVLRDPVRRDREGASGRLQCAACKCSTTAG